MGTYRMTCVGYEAEFIQVLVRNAPRWAELEKEKQLVKQRRKRLEEANVGAQGRSKKKERAPGTGSKRKPIEIESGSKDEDGIVEIKVGSDDSYEGMLANLPRSSASRPRRAAAMVKRQRKS